MRKSEIIVVASYNAQVNILSGGPSDGALVGTVGKFQGREAPVCLISMTATSVDEMAWGMEFLFSINRVNVADLWAKALALAFGAPRLRVARCDTMERMRLVNTLNSSRSGAPAEPDRSVERSTSKWQHRWAAYAANSMGGRENCHRARLVMASRRSSTLGSICRFLAKFDG